MNNLKICKNISVYCYIPQPGIDHKPHDFKSSTTQSSFVINRQHRYLATNLFADGQLRHRVKTNTR